MGLADKPRCGWCGNDPLYTRYHDREWGVPVHNDRRLFEFLILEGQQAGLSWITILRKREAFREAFDNFDFNRVVTYDKKKVKELLANPSIIRNRLKIDSAIRNARAFLEVRREFGTFNKYIWGFVDGTPIQNAWRSLQEMPASTVLAETISKDLKQRGFNFVGPTIVYSHMQATGMVNDHITSCYRHQELKP